MLLIVVDWSSVDVHVCLLFLALITITVFARLVHPGVASPVRSKHPVQQDVADGAGGSTQHSTRGTAPPVLSVEKVCCFGCYTGGHPHPHPHPCA